MNKKLVYLNFAVVALLALGLGYFVLQNKNLQNNVVTLPTEQPEESTIVSQSAEPSPSPHKITIEETQAEILKATNSTDRTSLEKYMASQVAVTLYATDCCQPTTAKEAATKMEYVNEGIPITFDQKNTTIVGLKAKVPTLANAYIGISQTKEHMIAFTINPETNLIEKIEMSVSWKLY